MIASSATPTPRPRPPGRIGKRPNSMLADALSSDSTLQLEADTPPPPPYHSAQPDLTEELTQIMALSNPSPPDIDEQWIKDKSKEELSQLLVKADAMIQRRQQELTLAASIGKGLLEKNLELKNRYDALLSRLPLSTGLPPQDPRHTPRESRRSDSWVTDDDEDTLLASTPFIPDGLPPPALQHRGHSRHISASPSAVAFLHTQNESLLSQLAAIEQETANAELHGKLNLKSLEKEISSLKAELETSQQRATELEEQMKANHLKEKKKLERDARLKSLRERLDKAQAKSAMRDFAPRGDLALSVSSRKRLSVASNRSDDSSHSSPTKDRLSSGADADTESADAPEKREAMAAISPSKAATPHEMRLTSLLLQKIAELENTNRDLLSRHLDTRSKLERVSKESQALSTVYDTLERDEEIEEMAREYAENAATIHIRHHTVGSEYGGSMRQSGGRLRSLSNASGRDKTRPWLKKRIRSSLSSATFTPPSPSPPPKGAGVVARSIRTVNKSSQLSRMTLQEEIQDAWDATLRTKSRPLSLCLDDEESVVFQTRTEAEIDAAVFAMRSAAPETPKRRALLITPFPTSGRVSPGPVFPGSYRSPEKAVVPLPVPEMKRRGLHKTTSLGSMRGQGSPELRRRQVARIESLDLAGEERLGMMEEGVSWTTLLVEVWVFLQFCVVLAAFVFAMARKGPKGVMRRK